MSTIFDKVAAEQPLFYRNEVAKAERFYISDEAAIAVASTTEKMEEIAARWSKVGVRVPFERVAFAYGENGMVLCKWYEPDDEWVTENVPKFSDTGGLLLAIISNFDKLTGSGGLNLSSVYVMLRPDSPDMSLVFGDNESYVNFDEVAREMLTIFTYGVVNTITNLHNMRTEYYEAAKKVQDKRAKKGKQPIISYHRLMLIGSHRVNKVKGRGSHSSPAYHKRRGHFRRYQSGKVVWVRDTMVGRPENGIILKDYSL